MSIDYHKLNDRQASLAALDSRTISDKFYPMNELLNGIAKIQELRDNIIKLRAELEFEILGDFETLKTKVEATKKMFPDYRSPLDTQPVEHKASGSAQSSKLQVELFDFLSTDVQKRVTRKDIIAKFGAEYGEGMIGNTLTRLYKKQTVVNGFKLQKPEIPEDQFQTFIKITA